MQTTLFAALGKPAPAAATANANANANASVAMSQDSVAVPPTPPQLDAKPVSQLEANATALLATACRLAGGEVPARVTEQLAGTQAAAAAAGASATIASVLAELVRLFAGDGTTGVDGFVRRVDAGLVTPLVAFAASAGNDVGARSNACRLVGNLLTCLHPAPTAAASGGAAATTVPTPALAASLLAPSAGLVDAVVTIVQELAPAGSDVSTLPADKSRVLKNALRVMLCASQRWADSAVFMQHAATTLLPLLVPIMGARSATFSPHAAAAVGASRLWLAPCGCGCCCGWRCGSGSVWSCVGGELTCCSVRFPGQRYLGARAFIELCSSSRHVGKRR